MKIYKIKVNGKTYKVELEAVDETTSATTPVKEEKKEEEKKPKPKPASTATSGHKVEAPIQGSVVSVKVKPGDKVKTGDVLLIIEAMKLENEVVSPLDGEIAEVLVSKGQSVVAKDVLVTIK